MWPLFFQARARPSNTPKQNYRSRLPQIAAILIVIESGCSIFYNNPYISNEIYYLSDGIAWTCDIAIRLCLINFMYYRFRGLYGRRLPRLPSRSNSIIKSRLESYRAFFSDIPRLVFMLVALLQVISCGMAIYSDIGTVAGVYTSNGEVSFGSVYILVDLSVSLLDASVCVQIWRLKASKAGAKLNQIEFVRAFIAIVCCAITTVSEAIIFSMGYDRQWEVYFILTSARIVFSEIFNSSLLAGLIDQTPSRVAKLSTQKNAQAVESNSKC
ncbi:expressed protein [Batrachochytrium dendrobatidis JAM81]|uniref:Expressed protein n=1 Tax=Batrachochytrium dendrobatidis (strain JAM81 / FGSC 10211) TaxID=684364 RepID=F4PC59_BATDJ|nr:uncharacterized protein BATDEDRAFT_36076 [Batrachochytrium dendrobatidis JAM81]EGF77165.1 expressed protein [Batrachochytrium dendrobatidis JAM81]|eukprot:XP_006682227.1 expressed protein [Batrachochytrium dendrobatidis JAM81]